MIDVEPDRVDLHRFERLLRDGRRLDPLPRLGLLREAVTLWRGEPLTDLTGEWVEQVRVRARHQRIEAVVSWAEAEIAVGEPGRAIDGLTGLLHDDPLVEPVAAVLVRALHAVGRAADARACYEQVRARLHEELGVTPGPALTAAIKGEAEPRRSGRVLSRLVPDLPSFAGRSAELDRLDALAAPVAVVSGTAGVGKTTTAIHWAHRVRDRFPGGQLYVNLRGFDPTGSPMPPEQAIGVLLAAWQLSPDQLPTDLAGRTALYRELLADQRVLVVLDNAHDAEQVRPLLPATPGCLAVVTSRNALDGLVARDGAVPVTLDLLDVDAGLELLGGRLGAQRVAAEGAAAREIVRRCAGLPLALAIVAARAAARPAFSLADLAAELADTDTRLAALAGDDPGTNLRTVFAWSHRTLTPRAAELFRVVGATTASDVGVWAAASLLAVPPADARGLLGELAGKSLVVERASGRYAMHDLLRGYARTLAIDADGAARRRFTAHLAATALAADRLLEADGEDDLEPLPPGVTVRPLADRARALRWFDAERRSLLDAVASATDDRQLCRLAQGLRHYLEQRGHWADWIAVEHAARDAAHRLGDRLAEGDACTELGRAATRLGDRAARDHFARALTCYEATGDAVRQAHVHRGLGGLCFAAGDADAARDHVDRALHLYGRAGHRAGQAMALNNLAMLRSRSGDYDEALADGARALALVPVVGWDDVQGAIWSTFGSVFARLDDARTSVRCYRRARALSRRAGDRVKEADACERLAEAQLSAGDPDAARRSWQAAYDILHPLGLPRARAIAARL
ncbi:NB-ARC domain-containing protein [Asanoa hainanensis]|uniref:NB-ARC domain-containing protein n=1 Tax=Asanoa hainanensis TaxID=560556 RepID=A0A239PC88_9ACTN|nr:BTAD domain-containing putative transcriptional regulator [Asanoa hainanensis]SNT64565.1 NB-ARC domain-containing protein [Asanoa hainanensis]